MSDTIEESNQGDLGNLPANEQKDTKEILDQIESEEKAKADTTAQDDAAKAKAESEKAQADADAKAKADEEANKKKTDGDEDPNKRRDTKLVPAWVLEKEKKQAEKRIGELEAEVKKISEGAGSKKDQTIEEAKDEKAERIKAAIEKFGVDVDPEFMKEIVNIASQGKELPEDVSKRLAEIDRLTNEEAIKVEEANFSRDFDKQILPLIQAEYGKDVSEEDISKIKESLKTIAYDPKYASIPYEEIYRGKADFRGAVTQKKRSAEGSHQSTVHLAEGEKDYVNMTDDEVKNLSGEDFDKWSEAMAKNEKKTS